MANGFTIVTNRDNTFFTNNKMTVGSGIPTSGSYKIGDIVISNSQANGVFGWVCTQAGNPGSWEVIGSGAGGGNSVLVEYSNIVEFTDARTSIDIGIPEYNKETDSLEVHYNGLLLAQDVHYSINEAGNAITNLNGSWNENADDTQAMIFVVRKSTAGLNVIPMRNVVDINNATMEVDPGIKINPSSDIVSVHLNGVLLMEGIDYKIENGKLIKVEQDEAWNPYNVVGQKMFIDVLRNKGSLNEPDMGSISKEHLTSELAGEINNNTNSVNSLTEIANSHTNLINNLTTQIENVDFSEVEAKIGDLPTLQTNAKDSLVAAINELFQNANNGKELIANAIGEPLVSTDTFSAMSTGINGLTSSFKSALMNNGVSVGSNDKFKQLIEKIALLADNEGKGIQYFELPDTSITFKSGAYSGDDLSVAITNDFNFIPTHIVLFFTSRTFSINSIVMFLPNYNPFISFVSGSSSLRVRIDTTANGVINLLYNRSLDGDVNCNVTGYLFGVGEEDTTLEDTLRDILSNKGVEVTEEDDLASLITKVDTATMKNLPQWMYDNEWMKLPECPTNGGLPATCNIDGNLFVVNGNNTCYLFDTDTGEWITKSPIGTTYTSFEPVYGLIDRQFHVVADSTKHKVYDVDLDTWSSKTDLSGYGINFGSVANSKFYGFKSTNYGYEFDPITDTWTSIGYVSQAHNVPPNCKGYGNNIYVIGGWDGNRYALNKTRVLDTLTNTWTNKSDCPGCTIYSAIDVIDNKIHLIAGQLYNKSDQSYTHYVYDIQNDSWSSKSNYPISMTRLGGCVINGWFYCGFSSDKSYVYIPQFDQ